MSAHCVSDSFHVRLLSEPDWPLTDRLLLAGGLDALDDGHGRCSDGEDHDCIAALITDMHLKMEESMSTRKR